MATPIEMSSKTCQLFGAAFASLRDDYGRPPWDERGISTAFWRNRTNDPAQTVRAMAKAVIDPLNETPGSVNFTSSQGPLENRCPIHPTAGIRAATGQCAGCYADTIAVADDAPPPDRPPPPDRSALVQQIRDNLSRTKETTP